MISKKKILFVLGTRPEAIKLAPLILALKENLNISSYLCITAQHRQMLDQVLDIFNIIPDYDFNLMTENQNLAQFTARGLVEIYNCITKLKPDLVLVQGDTTTVLCASLATFYAKVPLGHVEAGLRTWDLFSPWPEEGNRLITSKLASLHFSPTQKSIDNLLSEGVGKEKIFLTGNTAIDALFYIRNNINKFQKNIYSEILPIVDYLDGKIALITCHRRESFDNGLINICNAITKLAKFHKNIIFVFPVHLNPKVREPVDHIIKNSYLSNVYLLEPLSYPAFVFLMSKAFLILTDSGGVQEEAPSFGKPVLVLRNTTERSESIIEGSSILVGSDESKIISEFNHLVHDHLFYSKMSEVKNLYGDGNASKKIISICERYLGVQI